MQREAEKERETDRQIEAQTQRRRRAARQASQHDIDERMPAATAPRRGSLCVAKQLQRTLNATQGKAGKSVHCAQQAYTALQW